MNLPDGIRIMSLEDLYLPGFERERKICGKVGIQGTKFWEEVPSKCPHCNHCNIDGVELLGSEYNGVLMWICKGCEELILRFEQSFTESCLKKATKVWTNANDWIKVPKREFS